MKPEEIKEGKTYRNKGAGRTKRTVKAIGAEFIPNNWYSCGPRPNEPGVLYEQKGKLMKLYLGSFASWCGSEVSP